MLLTRALSLSTALLFALSLPTAGQGQILDAKKISNTIGNFTATLEEQDQLGRSVANLGDVNGDGISDLAIGAQGDDDGPGGLDRGAVYILFMQANGVVASHMKIAEGSGGILGLLDPGDQFGRAIGSIGDLDDDGVPDLVVGTNFDDDGGTNRGAVYVLFLQSDGSVRSHQKISEHFGNGVILGLSNFDEFGRAIDGLGDIDGDGVEDMVVGSSYDDDGGVNNGAVYIMFLNTDGTLKAHQKISQSQGNLDVILRGGNFFGHSVANMGDFDGDGINDLIVGSVLDDDGGENRGAVYIVLLNADGTAKDSFKISDTAGGFTWGLDDIDQFGVSVAGIGDVDGDGVRDLAVGAVKDDDGGSMTSSDVGAVYIIFMNADGTVKMEQKISKLFGSLRFNLDIGDWFGSSLSDLGGLPGDGPHQLAVGARYDDDGGGNFGAVYILELNPTDLIPPTTDFAADLTTGVAPLTVAFTDQTIGDVSSYQWNFGDGAFSTLQNPTYTYTDVGIYTVAMTAKNLVASDSEQKNDLIIVSEPPPLAGFSVLPAAGVAPLPVTFSDASTLNITSWSWDFGDGASSSTQNPTHTYMNVGTYTVTLTATSVGGMDTVTLSNLVMVGEPVPVASFTAGPIAGDAPLAVTFGDVSTLNITSWLWDFGDGTTSAVQSPTHAYTTAGTYTVSLTVTSTAGIDSMLTTDLIAVTEPIPVSAFTPSVTVGDIPLEITFVDDSTLNISSWAWDFGDGTTSTLQEPTHTYNTTGTFTVSLTVTSSVGTDVSSQMIMANEPIPIAAFTPSVSSGTPPLDVTFTDSSTLNITSWLWDFGDGTTSTLENPSHSFSDVGLHTVDLMVTSAGGTDSTTTQIEVTEPLPVAAFDSSVLGGEAPLEVTFNDLSTLNITSWSWDFGNGNVSSLETPIHTYMSAGTFDVTLTVTSAGGTDTMTQAMLIAVTEPMPISSFLITNGTGEAPLDVSFSDTSTLNITSWAWDFGDGATSSLQHPAHIFNTGLHTVSLTVTSAGGSNTVTMIESVTATEPVPIASFLLDQAVGDPPLSVTFTDTSTLNITSWLWDFGDGMSSSLQNPTHSYGAVGIYDLTLTVTSPAGMELLSLPAAITVTEPAPLASFTTSVTGGPAPLDVAFADTSTLNITSWAWDFGDLGTSSLQNPSHTFVDPGTYNISLTVTSAGGSHTLNDMLVVNVPAPVASFTQDIFQGDAPLAVNFTDGSTTNITGWDWDFGDGMGSNEQHASHVYTTEGVFTVTLTVTSDGGMDTMVVMDAVTVGEPSPVAAFAASPSLGDAPLHVVFTDNSTLNITSWLWDFGDGNTTTLQNPTHTYTMVGSYNVALRVESSSGVSLLQRNNMIVVEEPPPTAAFTLDVNQGPAPLAIAFTDTTTGVVSTWSWDFGDGSSSSLQSPTHMYPTVGTYTVTLTATGIGGANTLEQVGLVIVDEPLPVAEFSATNTVGFPPLQVDFADLSTLNITSWSWSFGDGNASSAQSPMYVYDTVGTFEVALTVTSNGGIDTETKLALVTVNEPPPVASFTPSITQGDMPLSVDFADTSSLNITSWSWNFGDGNTSTLQSPQHIYTVVGTYTVTLDVVSPGGLDTLALVDGIIVEEPPPAPAFSADVSVGPPSLLVTFTDATSGMVSMWSWDFGDGASSSLQSPTHIYDTVGKYTVSLTVTGIGGFETLTIVEMIDVTEPAPVAGFSTDVTLGDAPLNVTFTDSSTLNITTWAWDFGDLGTSSLQSPIHEYQPGTYTVSLTATSAGGMDTATMIDLITVSEPLPSAAFSNDTNWGPAPLDVNFTDDSTLNITAWAWDFGDTGTSSLQNPMHSYATPGTYTVSLTVTSDGGAASLQVTDAIMVVDPAPIPGFTADVTSGTAPLAVTFADATSGAVTAWAWSFGDGNTSTTQSPTHTFQDVGTYTVSLTATGIGGSNELVMGDLIVVAEPLPTASFTTSLLTGDVPLLVTFGDTSLLNVTSWAWDFGDGTTSSAQNPSHTYEGVGLFSVSLTVTSVGGTSTLTLVDHITTNEPVPVASFTSDIAGGDAPLSVVFSDASTLSITSWAWDFGDLNTSILQSPTHVFLQPGTYTVSMTVTSAGGADTLTMVDLITVVEPAPAAAFSMDTTSGPAPLTVTFSDDSTLNISTWSWSFGDGETSTLENPAHEYANVGTFTVTLDVTSAGGTDSLTQTEVIVVTEPAPTAAFTGDIASGDAPLTVLFADASTLNITAWAWDFGDGNTSSAQNPSHVYNDIGSFDVTLAVTSAGGTDMLVEIAMITVAEPVPIAAFSSDVTQGPLPLTVNFSDDSTLNITAWDWSFGDGDETGNSGGSSIEQNPTYVYSDLGTYTVSLTVTSSAGLDSLEQIGYIIVEEPAPLASFTNDVSQGPSPLTVNFSDTSTLNITGWSWDFGDLGTSSQQNPSHTYAAPGTYSVSLSATSAGGSDTALMVDLIIVDEPAPVASFIGTPITGTAPLSVQFTDTSSLNITGWSWDFGDGGFSSLSDPSHTYNDIGLYTVTLTVNSAGGMDTTTAIDLITVGEPPPVASFVATPVFGSAPLTVVFTDTSSSTITAWDWDFGDGFSSTLQNPSHLYDNGGTFTIGLTVTGPGGTDTITIVDHVLVFIDPPIANFDVSSFRGFAPLNVIFTDTSQGLVTSWLWDFGDGATSTVQNPSHVYELAGTYAVALTAMNGGGAHTERKHDFMQVAQPPTFGDGSFEGQTPGTQPRTPWRVVFGTGVGVNPTTVATDLSMPTHGVNWLEIGADGSSAAMPPSNPGGAGLAPIGAAQVRQNFSFNPMMSYLGFNATFILNGPAASVDFNDFMSVDLSDGTTKYNLYYEDSFSAFPLISDKFGLPMTDTATVSTNLVDLFPTAISTTILTLTISVGNGGDALNPSRGYADSFIFGMAGASVDRNGTGLNSMCYSAGPPVIGQDWSGAIDSSSHVAPGFALILCYSDPATGPTLSSGELLIDLASAPIFTLVVPSNGTLDILSQVVPNSLSLVGTSVSSQGMVYGSSMLELCNAVDMTVGF